MDALTQMIMALSVPGRLRSDPPTWRVVVTASDGKPLYQGGKVWTSFYEFTSPDELNSFVEWKEKQRGTRGINVKGPGIRYDSRHNGPWVRLEQ